VMAHDDVWSVYPQLTIGRLTLRELRPDDAEPFFAILSQPQVMEFYGNSPLQSVAEAHALISRLGTGYEYRRNFRWAITFADQDRLIGTCSLFHFDDGYFRAETGYELAPAYWGRGLMREAMSAVLTFGFRTMNLHRIEANIDIANERSRKLLLKLGFSYEGNLRQRYVNNGRFEDEHYFGLLTHEWKG